MEQEENTSVIMQLVLDGLGGRESDRICDRKLAFVFNNLECQEGFRILTEGETPWKTLQKAAEVLALGTKEQGIGFTGFQDIPELLRDTLDKDLIAFVLYLSSRFDLYTFEDYQENFYLAGIDEVLPGRRLWYGWGACYSSREEYYALVELV